MKIAGIEVADVYLPLQGEGWDGDGVSTQLYILTPIPTLTLPLKGRGLLMFSK
jgi:hypothetical protein